MLNCKPSAVAAGDVVTAADYNPVYVEGVADFGLASGPSRKSLPIVPRQLFAAAGFVRLKDDGRHVACVVAVSEY